MDDVKYWIWLQKALGVGAVVEKIFKVYETAEQIYFDTPLQRKQKGCFTVAQLRKLENAQDIDFAGMLVGLCEQRNWKIVTPTNKIYPDCLLKLRDRPLVLYVWGEFPDVENEFCLGVVGTRKPSEHAVKVTKRVATEISKTGAIIVSGGAMGIDTVAHTCALQEKGKTILVLGCGLGTDYLRKNEQMRANVSNIGCVITEFQPFTSATKYTFPVRNRIISALSRGVVVVEAALKSGALITARNAVEQGKDVFTTKNEENADNAGIEWLIKDGAKLVFSMKDILEEYDLSTFLKLDLDYIKNNSEKSFYDKLDEINFLEIKNSFAKSSNNNTKNEDNIMKKIDNKVEKIFHLEGLSDDAKKVFECVKNEEIHIDEICSQTSFTPNKVLAVMTELEMEGLVEPLSGRRFRCCKI